MKTGQLNRALSLYNLARTRKGEPEALKELEKELLLACRAFLDENDGKKDYWTLRDGTTFFGTFSEAWSKGRGLK